MFFIKAIENHRGELSGCSGFFTQVNRFLFDSSRVILKKSFVLRSGEKMFFSSLLRYSRVTGFLLLFMGVGCKESVSENSETRWGGLSVGMAKPGESSAMRSQQIPITTLVPFMGPENTRFKGWKDTNKEKEGNNNRRPSNSEAKQENTAVLPKKPLLQQNSVSALEYVKSLNAQGFANSNTYLLLSGNKINVQSNNQNYFVTLLKNRFKDLSVKSLLAIQDRPKELSVESLLSYWSSLNEQKIQDEVFLAAFRAVELKSDDPASGYKKRVETLNMIKAAVFRWNLIHPNNKQIALPEDFFDPGLKTILVNDSSIQ